MMFCCRDYDQDYITPTTINHQNENNVFIDLKLDMSSGQAWQWIKSIESTIDQALEINEKDKKNETNNAPPNSPSAIVSPAKTPVIANAPSLSQVFTTVSSIVSSGASSTVSTPNKTSTKIATEVTSSAADDEDDDEFHDIEEDEDDGEEEETVDSATEQSKDSNVASSPKNTNNADDAAVATQKPTVDSGKGEKQVLKSDKSDHVNKKKDDDWIRVRLITSLSFDDDEQSLENNKNEKKASAKLNGSTKVATPSPELSLLQEQVKRQTNQLNNVFSELSNREKQIQQLNSELAQLKNENVRILRLNDDVKMEAKEATDQFESLKNEFSERLAKEERKVAQLRREKQELKEKNSTELLQAQNQKVDALTRETEQLTKKITSLEQTSRKLNKTIQELESEKSNWNQMSESMKTEMNSLRDKMTKKDSVVMSDADDIAKRLRLIVSAVLNEWEQKSKALFDARTSIKNLESKLTQKNDDYQKLFNDYEHLQETMILNTDIAEKKQDALRKEIETLLKRCNMADVKNEDMITSLPDMTIPLLEQIEQLEKSANSKEEQWKEVEQRLNFKLKIAENNSKLAHMEQQKLQGAIDQLNATIEEQRKHIEKLNHQVREWGELSDRTKQQLNEKMEMLQPLQRENSKLKLDIEQLQILLGDSRKENEQLYQQIEKLKEKQSSSNSTNDNRQQLSSIEISEKTQPTSTENSSDTTHGDRTPVSPSSTEDTLSLLALVHNYEKDLRMHNAKNQSLLKRVEALEATKNQLSEELVVYTTNNRKLAKQITDQQQLQNELQELQKRHNAALELIGENEETIGDLQQDLKYVKEKFRIQITTLLEEIDLLKNKGSIVQ